MRIDGSIANADFVVEVVAGGAPTVSDVAYDLASNDGLTGHDGVTGEMAVDGFDAMAVIDDDGLAVAVGAVGELDGAVAGDADGGTQGGGDVDALVELAFAVAQDGIFPLAEATGDGAEDGPEGGGVGGGGKIAQTEATHDTGEG